MKIKHQDCHIDREHPFTNCKLGREKYANILTQIVGNYKNGFVLAINNKWGTGKTTFVKMWQQQLLNKGYNTLYYNSWENDFDANPLIAIMSELKTLTKKDSKTFKSLVSKGAVLTKKILPELLKVLSKKYLGTDDLGDLVKDTTEGATDILSDEIEEYAEKKKGLKDFKIDLEKYLTEIDKEKPLIFIIDELDRCRPNYAVELLEQIKHLFSVPGIVFVLSIDKEQLGHAVRGFYGSEKIEADEYLRRFIDVEYTLPQPNTRDFCNYLYNYFEFNSFFRSPSRQQYSEFNLDHQSLITLTSTLFDKANITLRQQEKIFAHARIGITLFKANEFVFPDLYMTLVFLKNFHNDVYDKIRTKEFNLQPLIDQLSELIPTKGLNREQIMPLVKLEAQLIYFYNNYIKGHNTYENMIYQPPTSSQLAVTRSSKIDSQSHQGTFNEYIISLSKHRDYSDFSLEHLLNKIDLTQDVVVQ